MGNWNPKVSTWPGGSGVALRVVDYTPPSSAVNAGDVLILGGIAHFAKTDISVGVLGALVFDGGSWAGNKASGGWTLDAPVYYDTAATPNVGTAASGAFTQTPTATSVFVGYCKASPNTTAAALTGDQYGYFIKANPVIGGSSSGGGTVQVVAALGTTAANAGSLIPGTNVVTGADGTKGVVLPAPVPGTSVKVINTAGSTLKVYPGAGIQINAIAAGTNIAQATITSTEYVCTSATQWYAIPYLPS